MQPITAIMTTEETLRAENALLRARLEKAEEPRAVQADLRKDEFIAMLGHELRNPLAAIANALHMIHELGSEPGTTEWAVRVIERQSSSLRRIVDDLLDVTRIARGRIELRLQRVDVGEVIGRAVEAVHSLFEEKHHEIEIDLAPRGQRWIEADPARLELCLVNLLVNAAKYTPEGGRIAITERPIGTEAVIAIRDNGIGIAPEMLPQVFELFAQANRALDRAEGGLGIGLNICRQLIGLHGGTVTAHSEGVGHGAEFTIRLPSGREAKAPAEAPAPSPTPRAGDPRVATQRRVLVVDDNLDAARTLSRLLNRRGHEVCIAYDGPSALKAAHDFQPDVLLLDIGLPGLDGYELGRRLRSEGFADALMIAISGYAHESDVENSHAAGFDRHFAKPVDFAEILQAIGSGSVPEASPAAP